MASKVQTLEERLKEAKQLVAMYRDLIANGESREQVVSEEIATLRDKVAFLRKARMNAPDSLSRALDTQHQLERQKVANRSSGYQGPSRVTLQRKADRADTLKDKLRGMIVQLRAAGLDPEELMREEFRAAGLDPEMLAHGKTSQ